ncbi:MAG TPA: hypothetical protein VGK43_00405 [Solirubrobacterales bacterium]
MPRLIDADALIVFLDRKVKERGKADASGLVITSVYSGLANRIRSGEFDVREFTDPGFEHHEEWCHLQHGLGGRCTCK